jgi:prophage antirepressor-like protein
MGGTANEDRMSAVIPFVFTHDEEQIPIRVLKFGDDLWFVGADVCSALGLLNSRQALSRLKNAQRGVIPMDTPSGTQTMTIISESGLYLLTMRSDKPRAKAFQDWIADDVLPTIRRTGKYELPVAASPQPDLLLPALNRIDVRLGRIETKLDRDRAYFSTAAIRIAYANVDKFNDGYCIYCNQTKITERGRPLGNSERHHGDLNRVNSAPDNCQVPCNYCHDRIHQPNHADPIKPLDAITIASEFQRRVRQKQARINAPDGRSIIHWDFRAATQADMGFPVSAKGKK